MAEKTEKTEKKSPVVAAKVVEPEEEKLRQQLQSFVADATKDEFAFPATLSPKERAIVHSLAEQFGLNHSSEGTGNERHLKVSKTVRPCSRSSVEAVPKEIRHNSPTAIFALFLFFMLRL